MESNSAAIARLSNIRKHLQPEPSSSSTTTYSSSHLCKGEMIKISSEVSDALSRGAPVVALESTIICHGMPYPQNFKTAKEIEAIVRDNGAIPAII